MTGMCRHCGSTIQWMWWRDAWIHVATDKMFCTWGGRHTAEPTDA